jgi:transcriptional regulator with XRE-family HTH domain
MPERGVAFPLYERVERERVLRGWSSTQMEDKTGVARQTVGKWRTNPMTPQPGTVNAVADALGIDREEALRLAGILTSGIPEDAPLCSFERETLDSRILSPDQQAGVIAAHRARGHDGCTPLAGDAKACG